MIISDGNNLVKPPPWAIDPGFVADNAQAMGLPMPVAYWAMWEDGGSGVFELIKGTLDVHTGSWYPFGLGCMEDSDYLTTGCTINQILISSGGTKASFFFTFYAPTVTTANYTSFFGDGAGYSNLFFGKWTTANAVQLYWEGVITNFALGMNIWDGEVHSIALTVDTVADVQKVYVDGILKSIQTSSLATMNQDEPILLGVMGGDQKTYEADGVFGCFHIYADIFTPTQVATLSADPYGLVRMPSMEELWAYYEAAGGQSVVPIIMQQMNQFNGGTML